MAAIVKGYDIFEQNHKNTGYCLVKQESDNFSFLPLTSFDSVYKQDETVTIGFCDPSTLEANPGWPLRNFLILVAQNWGDRIKQLNVICYRDRTVKGTRQIDHSLYMYIEGVSVPDRQDVTHPPKVLEW